MDRRASVKTAPVSLATVLTRHRAELIRIWRQRVLSDPAVPEANRLAEPALVDHLPDLIDRAIRVLEAGPADRADGEQVGRSVGGGDESRAHAEDRLAARYGLRSALRELSHLRAAVLDLCAREGATIANEQWLLFNADLDEVMVLAASRLHEAAQAELRQLSETLETFMANAPVGFAVIDPQFRYRRINQALADMNGVPVQDHIGRRVPDVIPQFAEEAESLLRRVVETRQPLTGLRIDLPERDDQRHLLASYYPLETPTGEVDGVGGVIVDITDQTRAEQELRKDAELRERFMGILGHDLRTPLAAILLTAQALLRNENVPPGYIRSLQRIKDSGRRAERMVNDLVDLVRSRQGGGIPLVTEPRDLNDVCQDVVAELNATYPERTIELVRHGCCEGRWDPDRIAQLATNLIANAILYSPPETAVTVEIDGRDPKSVCLRVHNHGPPIPADLMPVLFDPFRRGSSNAGEQRRGLGLGLHIASEIARAHGGCIQVASTPMAGTTFTVTLPRDVPR
jgi:PAS domain S-box-containing protein